MKRYRIPLLGTILFLLFLTLLILVPLMMPGFIVTDDGEWMVIRLTAFYQAFADGQFPVRFLSRLNNNYGYPVSNFLYPGFLYLGSILRLFKLSYPFIIECILGGSVIVSVVFMYLWLRKFFSSFLSFIGACSLLVSPYFLYDLYKRGSVGELFATAGVIVLLWSIESGFVWILPPVTAVFLISHNTLAFLFSLFLVGYVWVRRKYAAIVPLSIGLLISSFFWIPAIFERSFVRFDGVQVANPFDYLRISQTLLFMSIPFFVPLVLLLKSKKRLFDHEYLYFSVILCLVATGSSVLGMVFWSSSVFMRFVQFPYRLLSLLFIAGPWLFAYFISQMKDKKRVWMASLALAVLFSVNIPLLFGVQNVIREEGYYTTNEGTTTVRDEYMPKWVTGKPDVRPREKLEIFSGKGTLLITESSTKKFDAEMKLEEESVIRLNTVFYPGWGATLDGKPVELSYQNAKGVMEVIVPKGDHTISFEFRETGFRYISDILSSIGIIAYGGYLLFLLTKGVRKKSRV